MLPSVSKLQYLNKDRFKAMKQGRLIRTECLHNGYVRKSSCMFYIPKSRPQGVSILLQTFDSLYFCFFLRIIQNINKEIVIVNLHFTQQITVKKTKTIENDKLQLTRKKIPLMFETSASLKIDIKNKFKV